MTQLAPVRPPFVEFKRLAVHDPIRTAELGRRVTKDVNFAFIMQPGSRDQVERYADDWLKMIKDKVLNASADAYPEEWVSAFERKYEAWKAGHEAPLNGTSVKEWSYLSPAQCENFIGLRIVTIEDVAAMTEDAMMKVGMGARELREKAREWCQGQEVAKTVSKENEDLKNQLAALQAQVALMTAAKPVKEAIQEKAAELGLYDEKPEPKKRGRKPKVTE